MRPSLLSATILLTVLCGCESLAPASQPYAKPINVVALPDGSYVAVPPECPNWHDYNNSAFDNTQWPQFGCSTARNLALQIDRPEDLINGRDSGAANPETTSASMRRYLAGKTTPLIDPNASSPTMGGATGGGVSLMSSGGGTTSSGP